jgi:hypothetical protein
MTVPFGADELRGDDVVRQDVSLLAVIPENTHTFYLLACLVREGIVNRQPSFAPENPLGLEHVDSGIIDVLLFPDPCREKSVESAGVPGLNENPVDAFYRQVFRDDQSQDVALEMLKGRRPEMRAESFESLFEILRYLCDDRHCALPRLRRHFLIAPFRVPQAFIHSPSTFLYIHSAPRSCSATAYCARLEYIVRQKPCAASKAGKHSFLADFYLVFNESSLRRNRGPLQ